MKRVLGCFRSAVRIAENRPLECLVILLKQAVGWQCSAHVIQIGHLLLIQPRVFLLAHGLDLIMGIVGVVGEELCASAFEAAHRARILLQRQVERQQG
ncbi:hypothetical protein D3C75_1139270 [compost metagenome]